MVEIKMTTPEDAPAIGRAVVEALHRPYDPADPWAKLFTRLAARADSQYSYLNTLKAVTPAAEIAGIIVAYDGGRLAALRQAFFEEFHREFGRAIGPVADETLPGEWYLDSLAVFSEFQGQGIGRQLLRRAVNSAPKGLTPTLLCSKNNPAAKRLYLSEGFRQTAERPFLGELMDVMQKQLL